MRLVERVKGKVYSYTIIYKPSIGHEIDVPYIVALVKLLEGPMITAQLTDVNDKTVEIDMPVEMVARKICIDKDRRGVYGYKFRPQISI